MATNRISAYLRDAEEESIAENAMPHDAAQDFHNPLSPPAGFAPVPEALRQGMSKDQLAWQQELYRTAYQSALAAIAAEALRRAQGN